MTAKEKDKQGAIEQLRNWIEPGMTLYTHVDHVSRSGMYRAIQVYYIKGDVPQWISRLTARALGWGFDEKNSAIRVQGCGMDMGFHTVYSLSYVLFPDGFGCVGEKCPSNDHSNGDRDYIPHMDEKDRIGADGKLCTCHKTHWHRDGGYALKQCWL